MKVNNITWGLFRYKKRHILKNFKDVPRLFGRIIYTLKHGYAPQANWETFAWFTDVMKEILTNIRYSRSEAGYNQILDEMIFCLNDMDEDSPSHEDMTWEEIDDAKNRFFELFSKYFYTFWD